MPNRRRATPSIDARERLADEAARLMVEHGIDDFGLAKRKAAARLGLSEASRLPTNVEIQARVVERQRLFEPTLHDEHVGGLRRIAASLMGRLEAFRPRLVGSVLDGSVTPGSAIELHVFADAPELVAFELEQAGYRVTESSRRYRFDREHTQQIPGFKVRCEDEDALVMVFPERGSHHAPRSPVDGRPMRRASRAAVLALLAEA